MIDFIQLAATITGISAMPSCWAASTLAWPDPPSKRHRRAEEIDRRVPLLVSFSPRAREEHSHAVRWPETACDVLETARADFREWSAVREICRRGCRIEERAEASSPRTREGIKTRLHERRHRSRLRWAAK
jgi:hypothetical protein